MSKPMRGIICVAQASCLPASTDVSKRTRIVTE
jgi:hypothetical protein